MTNIYFNNFEHAGQQDLISSLIEESIAIYGHHVWYCPRSTVKLDEIYGEDILSEYNDALMMDMYIRSYDSYEGDGSFLSKFNIEIRDQTTFTISRRTFGKKIGEYTELTRPREGDLIYSKMLKRLMVIKYVNNTAIFYQMGDLQVWDIVCEVFEYSNEKINTGVPEIDSIERDYSFNEEGQGVMTADGYLLTDEDDHSFNLGQFDHDEQLGDVFSDNKEFKEDVVELDWNPDDPFSEALP